MYSLIFAIDESMLVGNTKSKYGMPWHYPEDLKFYKEMTTGQDCVMGRETYEQIGGALPNRNTFVLTRNKDYSVTDATIINDIDEIDDSNNWFICGGVNVFEQFMPKAGEIYITRINKTYEGDVYYKSLNLSDFKCVSSKQGNNKELIFEKWVRDNGN